MYAKSFAVDIMKQKRLTNDLENALGYSYVYYKSCIQHQGKNFNAGCLIQIKVKNDKIKTNGVEIHLTSNYNCSNKK